MKRTTKNVALLETIKRQEQFVRSLQQQIVKMQERERIRDDAWERHTDMTIKKINTIVRTAKTFKDYEHKMNETFK